MEITKEDFDWLRDYVLSAAEWADAYGAVGAEVEAAKRDMDRAKQLIDQIEHRLFQDQAKNG